jgi:hypothetical protein
MLLRQVALLLLHRKALSGYALIPAFCDGTLGIAAFGLQVLQPVASVLNTFQPDNLIRLRIIYPHLSCDWWLAVFLISITQRTF